MKKIKFDSFGGQLIKVPVVVNGNIETTFLLDTGAGVNIISDTLCKDIGCKTSGSYTGKRMTGEEATLSFTSIPTLSFGDYKQDNVRAGVVDLFSKLPEELGKIDGALSCKYFENIPFTLDYLNSEVEIGKSIQDGVEVPIQLNKDHEKLVPFIKMEKLGTFEVDTGNSLAVLDLSQAEKLNIDLNSSNIEKIEGKNETGYPFTAYYTNIPHLQISGTDVLQNNPRVAFKKIIYDGVIGNDFFKDRSVTFDIQNKKIVLK